MWRIGIFLTAGTLILANGYLHGLWSHYRGRSPELDAAVGKIDGVPMTIGDWQARSDELDAASVTNAGIEGYFLRHYENVRNRKTITVLLTCGRPGPMCVHSPDICYKSVGYTMAGAIGKESYKYGKASASAEFNSGKFAKTDATGASALQQIQWSWSAEGPWQVPAEPRLTFARSGFLYKLYVTQQVTSSGERLDREACKEFLEKLLPEVDKALFAPK